MKVVTSQEMRAIDGQAIEEYGIPGLVLMEHAGWQVARRAWDLLADIGGRKVVVFAGTGNNGGDGCVAARHLFNWGARVRIVLAGDPNRAGPDAAKQLEMARRLGIEVVPLTAETRQKVRLNAAAADVLVDALLGTGSKGAPRGAAGQAVDILNGSGKPVVAVDIPSGVDADTGAVPGNAVQAEWTVTFGLPKVGLLLSPGRRFAGRIAVVDIGLPRMLLERGSREWVEEDFVRKLLPPRPRDGHKGTFGHVLVVGGSRGMSGAALLAARGAQRVGAGLVTVAGPASLQPVFSQAVMEALTQPLPEDPAGLVAPEASAAVLSLSARTDVLVIGPGLSRTPGAGEMVRRVLDGAGSPAVVDADALYALGPGGRWLESRSQERPLVLTPHPGEMARLLDGSVADVLADPLGIAVSRARAWKAVVVLKGAPTVVADPSGQAFINSTGSDALATGGTGDVLAGAIAGLMAQGAAPLAAAVAGVYVHGLAGELAAAQLGPAGVVAGDVVERIPAALARVRGERGRGLSDFQPVAGQGRRGWGMGEVIGG
ncbi:MAG: NAD(P)H-hydrate dehydratase [Firmicutes bacterium]|nr:NAD(P)H-hydrate dehydratase [Bacillota bacterium]